MTDVKFADVANQLKRDGALRDIYVLDAGSKGWLAFMTALQVSDFKYIFSGYDDGPTMLPIDYAAAVDKEKKLSSFLKIDLDGFYLHCYFFTEDEIELDFSPQEVVDDAYFGRLLGFLQWLAKVTNHKVIVTHENTEHEIIFSISPDKK